jgi:hypothetical protein
MTAQYWCAWNPPKWLSGHSTSLESGSERAVSGSSHLLASWSPGYWGILCLIAWRAGGTGWEPHARWFMLGLGMLGVFLLIATGALGGHLAGRPTAVSHLFARAGREVFTTFQVPTATLAVILLAACALFAIAMISRRA